MYGDVELRCRDTVVVLLSSTETSICCCLLLGLELATMGSSRASSSGRSRTLLPTLLLLCTLQDQGQLVRLGVLCDAIATKILLGPCALRTAFARAHSACQAGSECVSGATACPLKVVVVVVMVVLVVYGSFREV